MGQEYSRFLDLRNLAQVAAQSTFQRASVKVTLVVVSTLCKKLQDASVSNKRESYDHVHSSFENSLAYVSCCLAGSEAGW